MSDTKAEHKASGKKRAGFFARAYAALFEEPIWWKRALAQLGAGVVILIIAYAVLFMYSNKPPVAHLPDGTALDWNDKTAFEQQLERVMNERVKNGIVLYIDDVPVTVPSKIADSNVFHYDTDATTESLWNKAHPKYPWQPILISKTHMLDAEYDTDALTRVLTARTAPFISEYKAPGIEISEQNTIAVIPEQPSQSIAIEPIVKQIEQSLDRLVMPELSFNTKKSERVVETNAAEKFISGLRPPRDTFPLLLTVQDISAEITSADWFSYLEIHKRDEELKLSFNKKGVAWLSELIAPLNAEPDSGNIEISEETGKTVEFAPARRGGKVSISDSASGLIESWLLGNRELSGIQIDIVEPESEPDTAAAYGIFDALGTGTSNFRNSPKNRIHNITVGMNAVHGTMIPPGEEFSLLAVLGNINAETGYLPELVIKGNKTVPEYGGGLCQIGTSVFRGTLATALPVTERRNHSYTVSYYFPIGTDATIYDPWPDYKFKNDTEHWILITGEIDGYEISFTYWGKKDGRISEYPEIPKTYNRVSPPPTKIIETTELEPGEEKCTEHAHDGIDASFDYIITYANGETHEQTFVSHYKPWQAVCLKGVSEESEDEEKTEAESEEQPISIDIPETEPEEEFEE